MNTIKNFLIGSGVLALILFVIVLVIGFDVVSGALVAIFYIIAAIFLIILIIYLYRKAKHTFSGDDGRQ